MVVRDPVLAEQAPELLRPEEVALDLILQVLLPVEADRSGNVGLSVERRVLVDLDDADALVVQVLREPLGLHQHVLRILSHGDLRIPVAFCPFTGESSAPRQARSNASSPSIAASAASSHASRSAGSASSSACGISDLSQAARTVCDPPESSAGSTVPAAS